MRQSILMFADYLVITALHKFYHGLFHIVAKIHALDSVGLEELVREQLVHVGDSP